MHLKQTLASLRRTVYTRCCNVQYLKSQLQNSSLSVVTGIGTLDPSPLGSRRCMAARPLEKGTLRVRILEYAFANKLVVGNTWFKKKPEHLVTYQTGNAATQIDFILYQRSFRKQVSNVKVILGEECASQHRLLVGDFRVSMPPQRKFVPRIKVWKLRDPEKQAELSEVFKAKTLDSELSQTSTVDELWTSLKDSLAGYKAGVRCFLEPPMEEADLVVEQPGGGISKGETQVL